LPSIPGTGFDRADRGAVPPVGSIRSFIEMCFSVPESAYFICIRSLRGIMNSGFCL
jgi:hypothetical protein